MVESKLVQTVLSIAHVFHERGVDHAMIGGLAVALRARPRATKDADFILRISAIAFPALLEALAKVGFDIDTNETIRRWSSDRLIVLYREGIRVDFMQPVVPLYTHVLDTATHVPWRDAQIGVASVEGLILTKLVSFRPQDLVDIETLLTANRNTMNLDSLRAAWAKFGTDETMRTSWLESAIQRNVEDTRN